MTTQQIIEQSINREFSGIEDKIDNLFQSIINNISKKAFDGELIVYRTEKAHSLYKGKAVWGDGLYFGLYKDEVAELTLDPFRKFDPYSVMTIRIPNIESVKEYKVPIGTKLKGFNLDMMTTNEFNELPYGNEFKNKIVSEGYDGVIILTDDLNHGGNQVIIYNQKIIDKILYNL